MLAATDKVKASQELHEEDVEINKLLGETVTSIVPVDFNEIRLVTLIDLKGMRELVGYH